MYSVLYIIPGQLFLEETPSSSHTLHVLYVHWKYDLLACSEEKSRKLSAVPEKCLTGNSSSSSLKKGFFSME